MTSHLKVFRLPMLYSGPKVSFGATSFINAPYIAWDEDVLIPELVDVSVADFFLGLVEAELLLEEILFIQNLLGLG